MEITLEQSLAAAVRYIQDNAGDGTKMYFDEIPEDFYVPSVYFQIPFTAGRKATLMSYCTTITLNVWFMEHLDWDAYAKAADMRDSIMLDDCLIPVYEKDGTKSGRCMRVGVPNTRKIEEGVTQLSFEIETYFRSEKGTTKVQKLHAAWKEVMREIKE